MGLNDNLVNHSEGFEGRTQAPARRTPCSDFVHRSGALPRAFKDGFLSVTHGFLSPTKPAPRLPESHQAWDDAVGQVPRLTYTEKIRGLLDKLPLLASDPDTLRDEALPRAATVLSILASAYWRHGLERAFAVRTNLEEDPLPDAILRPWTEVTHRLGRGPRPFQSFYDVFLNNFRLRSSDSHDSTYRLADVRIENLDVLTPSFGNEPERIFCMSFVELHAIAGAIVAEICALERAIVDDSPESVPRLIQGLETIENSLRACTATLKKIQPVRGSKTYCDPNLWAKTVAVGAFPSATNVQGGTSGSCGPFVFVVDALLSRNDYGTYDGKYICAEATRVLPVIHQEFTRHVRNLPLKAYILSKKRADPTQFERLATAYDRVASAYAGDGRFLDKHMAKAFNYLGVATLAGRNQSTSGHERHVRQETWNAVAAELKISLSERLDLFGAPAVKDREPAPPDRSRPAPLPVFRPEQVARHHKKSDGWVIINGFVYDVTPFIEKHPGGPAIVRGYLGRDVTAQFSLVSAHHSPAVGRLLQSFLIGTLDTHHDTATHPSSPGPKPMSSLLVNFLRVHGLLDIQYDHDAPEPQKTLFRMQAYLCFCNEHLLQSLEMIRQLDPEGPPAPSLDGALLACSPEMRQADWSNPEEIRRLRYPELTELYLRRSLGLMDELIEIAACASETPTNPRDVQSQVWAAVTRWRDAVGTPVEML